MKNKLNEENQHQGSLTKNDQFLKVRHIFYYHNHSYIPTQSLRKYFDNHESYGKGSLISKGILVLFLSSKIKTYNLKFVYLVWKVEDIDFVLFFEDGIKLKILSEIKPLLDTEIFEITVIFDISMVYF